MGRGGYTGAGVCSLPSRCEGTWLLLLGPSSQVAPIPKGQDGIGPVQWEAGVSRLVWVSWNRLPWGWDIPSRKITGCRAGDPGLLRRGGTAGLGSWSGSCGGWVGFWRRRWGEVTGRRGPGRGGAIRQWGLADLGPRRDVSCCCTWIVPESCLDRSAAPTSVQPCPWLPRGGTCFRALSWAHLRAVRPPSCPASSDKQTEAGEG